MTMTYERAKTELEDIVTSLEMGGLSLDETLELWDRGVERGKLCQQLLNAADQRIEAALAGADK